MPRDGLDGKGLQRAPSLGAEAKAARQIMLVIAAADRAGDTRRSAAELPGPCTPSTARTASLGTSSPPCEQQRTKEPAGHHRLSQRSRPSHAARPSLFSKRERQARGMGDLDRRAARRAIQRTTIISASATGPSQAITAADRHRGADKGANSALEAAPSCEQLKPTQAHRRSDCPWCTPAGHPCWPRSSCCWPAARGEGGSSARGAAFEPRRADCHELAPLSSQPGIGGPAASGRRSS